MPGVALAQLLVQVCTRHEYLDGLKRCPSIIGFHLEDTNEDTQPVVSSWRQFRIALFDLGMN